MSISTQYVMSHAKPQSKTNLRTNLSNRAPRVKIEVPKIIVPNFPRVNKKNNAMKIKTPSKLSNIKDPCANNHETVLKLTNQNSVMGPITKPITRPQDKT